MNTYQSYFRQIPAQHRRLAIDENNLKDNTNLYEADLTSHTTHRLMSALDGG
jgi:hypothetical protein